ncbi:MAG TPA: hypothetical protein VI873_00910 [Candidatus Peribacteraceae bacterium]|nr:hypothetical protein [Candidatus Peribacteraceae bacterium]
MNNNEPQSPKDPDDPEYRLLMDLIDEAMQGHPDTDNAKQAIADAYEELVSLRAEGLSHAQIIAVKDREFALVQKMLGFQDFLDKMSDSHRRVSNPDD